MKSNNIEIDDSLILPGNFMDNTAAETIRNYIHNTGKVPGEDFDSVVGVNDFSARGAP